MLVYILKTQELPFELDPADTLETSAQEHRKCKIFGYSILSACDCCLLCFLKHILFKKKSWNKNMQLPAG